MRNHPVTFKNCLVFNIYTVFHKDKIKYAIFISIVVKHDEEFIATICGVIHV